MAKLGDIISKTIESYEPKKTSHELTSSHLEDELYQELMEKENALREIEKNYQQIEEDKVKGFLTLEEEYIEAIDHVKREYQEIFEHLDLDENNLRLEIESASKNEDETFDKVINSVFDLKNEAYQQFLRMVQASNDAIDDEMRVHTEFISSETEKFNEVQRNYQEMQTEQSNKLLWTIEQSRNALTDLSNELFEKSKNETGFVNESILSTLNNLRTTKNKMSALFKSATDMYTKQRERITALSNQRQKPHTIINQTIIHQFVKQIKEVNQKKVSFEKLILSELKTSKEIIGKKIIESDQAGDLVSTEKYILQYEIIQNKADYLLRRNQSMADLLISKYQNEIKKIKIDSFKRVEEIKLAYMMPAMFFQNSIILYSNFSFYVNESFDELDNLLSDLIVFNSKFAEAKVEYITQDAKAMEDYRINLMVRVSNVCSNLTELISKIDYFSKEIITLESQNHLEIAEVRKQMENAEIQGDYDKYIRSIEDDHFFAISQHESNHAKIMNRFEKDYGYIRIQREVGQLRQNFDFFRAKAAYLKEISVLEQEVHRISFEKNLSISRSKTEYEIKLNDTKYLMTLEAMRSESNRLAYLYATRYLEEESVFKDKKETGSKEVIDFLQHSQKLIDYNRVQTEQIVNEVESSTSSRTYAHYLEYMRSQIITAYENQLKSKIKLNEQATKLIHHPFYVAKSRIDSIIDPFMVLFKQRLVLLDQSNVSVLKSYFENQEFFGYRLMKAFDEVETELETLLVEFNQLDQLSNFKSFIDKAFEETVILIHNVKTSLSHKKPKHYVKPLNTFLIEQILNLKHLLRSLNESMDVLEKELLENDVIFIQKSTEKAEKIQKIINQEYDRLIFYAVKSDKHRTRQSKELSKEAYDIESSFKDEVKKINTVYVNSLEKETEKLSFVRKQISKLILSTESKLKKDLSVLEKAYLNEQHALHLKSRLFEKAYQDILDILSENLDEEFYLISKMEEREKVQLQVSLSILEKELQNIPLKYDEKLRQLSENKNALVTEKKSQLLADYTKIEEKKFSSRPELLAKMDEIKNRLPSDYLAMYQNISKAEEQFLTQYLNITTDYTSDFEEFLNRQKSSRALLSNQEFLYQPLQSFINLEETLLSKNLEAYDDTLFKAKATKDLLLSEEAKAKDKENRIIND